MEEIFPEYLRDLLAYSGYTSKDAISSISEEDINRLEEFAKNTLSVLLAPQEKSDFFGLFIANTSMFSIVDGDKKVLKTFISRCAAEIQPEIPNKNVQQLSDAQEKSNKKQKSRTSTDRKEVIFE